MSIVGSALFGAGVRLRNALYERGIVKPRHLAGPVISIGNLAVGGSGKTPFTILLGELLRARGIAFDVLSRGYGRTSRGVHSVDPLGTAAEFGDEPLLIARKLHVPVIVGEDRYAAGAWAERESPRLHLLDDGFQHRQLARDFDIVLVTPDDLRDRLLPAGRLREPLAALRRADAIVLSAGASGDQLRLRDGQKLWRLKRGILPPRTMPARPVAFCGIARPQNFFLQLRKADVEPAAEAAFRDHYRYSERDIRDLQALAMQSEADGFVTTEKDEVNLGALAQQLRPLTIVPLRVQWEDAQAALDSLLATLRARCPQWVGAAADPQPLLDGSNDFGRPAQGS